jgi:protease-4
MIERETPVLDGTARAGASSDGKWERSLIEKLTLGMLQEKRRARRWGILFKLLTFVWLAAALLMAGGWLVRDATVVAGRHTALIELDGIIAADGDASAEDIVSALRSAFGDRNTAGVVLRINSPGGSPVQAGMIHDEIRRLRAEHPDTPLYAVVEEVCASGGYYVAAAADRIYVDKASLVGSIGVLMDGFGFVETLEKLGIERRLLTSGANKGFLDSFSPLAEDQRRHAETMLGEIHRQFIDVVRAGRGDRLKDEPELYSGLVWTGARSIELGLSDALGSVDSVARDVIEVENVVDFSTRKNLLERLSQRVGASAGQAMLRALRAETFAPTLR